MTILIRADASITIGSGHIMRTLELARRLHKAGYRIIYLCKPLEGNLTELIRQRGFEVRELPPEADEYDAISHTVEELEPYLLMIDHYEIGEGVEKQLKKRHSVAIFCYDDTFESHHCDLLLNQNIYAKAEDYRDKVPKHAKILAGVEYSAIRSEFYQAKEHPKTRTETPKLLITLGGTDPDNISSKVLGALNTYTAPLEITVVVGPGNSHKQEIIKLGESLESCRILCDVTDMAILMREADFAITAAGQTTIEALFMELPTINIMIADNQWLITSHLQKQGLSLSLTSDFTSEELYGAIQALTEEHAVTPHKLSEISKRIGTLSVVDAINCLYFGHFSINPTVAEDIRPLFKLANDSEVRANSLSTNSIAWEAHESWFAKVMAEPLQRLYTLKDMTGIFMGQLRFDCHREGVAMISISIVKAARGCGLAPNIIRRGVALFLEATPERTIEAIVKEANHASLKSFEKAGFKKVRENADTVILHLEKAKYEEY